MRATEVEAPEEDLDCNHYELAGHHDPRIFQRMRVRFSPYRSDWEDGHPSSCGSFPMPYSQLPPSRKNCSITTDHGTTLVPNFYIASWNEILRGISRRGIRVTRGLSVSKVQTYSFTEIGIK